ncbi:membrane protein [Candidatus Francisella endociliophora]|uniref:Membrane protein n=1 Tax=Candidatus Francisella endociliophora TaxID=653937 RepID=A0A097ENK0_9GAMM|nr:hypothetical protein [Francisella sp. FSC1006]AIT09140.1 membrane protein [Francisella sp. FSC1006]
MLKKLITFTFFTIMICSIGVCNTLNDKKKINTSSPTQSKNIKECNKISTLTLTPITIAGIGVGSILMAPVGLIGGAITGAMMSPMMFDSGGLNDNAIIQPIQITGAVILGSVVGAGAGVVELPIETAATLSSSARSNCYMV